MRQKKIMLANTITYKDLSQMHSETRQTAKTFQDDGVVCLRNIVSNAEISAFLRELDDITHEAKWLHLQNLRCRYALEPQSGEQILDALDPIIDISSAARGLAFSENLHSALIECFGEKAHLFKDKYFFRRAGAPGYPPHQDFIAWPFFPRSFTTALIALDPMSAENGGLTFYPGSHRQGSFTKADGDFHTIAHHDLAAYSKVQFDLCPGDVILFDGFIVHESGTNMSRETRRSLYLSFNKASDGGDQREAHYRFFHSWMKKRFGEYGASELYFA